MSTREDIEQDAKREAYEDRVSVLLRNVEDCRCGGEWVLVQTTVYGDDADGRRGIPLRVFECSGCGDEREVLG